MSYLWQLLVPTAHAAADAELVNAANDIADAAKDNIYGTLLNATFLTTVIGIMVLFLVIKVVPRFIKRNAR